MTTPAKIDLFKAHKDQYKTPKTPALVTIPDGTYLAITGQGEPGGAMFSERIGALYAVAFTIKMTRRFGGQQDYVVSKLEAQYWCGKCGNEFHQVPKSDWCWRLMIRTPEFVSRDELRRAVDTLLAKGKTEPVRDVALESLAEGLCVQMLHVGPYEREPETIALMLAHAKEKGLRPHGRHHEIYLSDPRRVPAGRLKTILRLPLEPAVPHPA